MLLKENINYGFCRNLLGMRPTGVATSLLGFAACVAAGLHYRSTTPWFLAIACLAFLARWVFTIRPDWVRIPAVAYAERLLECLDREPNSDAHPVSKS